MVYVAEMWWSLPCTLIGSVNNLLSLYQTNVKLLGEVTSFVAELLE